LDDLSCDFFKLFFGWNGDFFVPVDDFGLWLIYFCSLFWILWALMICLTIFLNISFGDFIDDAILILMIFAVFYVRCFHWIRFVPVFEWFWLIFRRCLMVFFSELIFWSILNPFFGWFDLVLLKIWIWIACFGCFFWRLNCY
jgi:hypothetical protein